LGGLWHPALPGCQDIAGPIPSVFLDSGTKLKRKIEIQRIIHKKGTGLCTMKNSFLLLAPVEKFDCLQPQKKMLKIPGIFLGQAIHLFQDNNPKNQINVLFLHF
jgi:hypothetical protein